MGSKDYQYGELEEIFLKIKTIINNIESKSIDNNESLLMLSNGDALQLRMPKNKIAHLLGINTTYLDSLKIFSEEGSYNLLKALIDNPYKIHNLKKTGIINYSNLFSDYLKEKIDIFAENMKINVQETLFVCKYSSERSYKVTENNQKYDYIIVRQTNEGKYYVLCLVKDYNNYVPMSSQVFESFDEIDEFLQEKITNQEITILRSLSVRNKYNGFLHKSFLIGNEIVKKIEILKNIKIKYNTIIDTTGALEFYLKQSNARYDQDTTNTEVVSKVVESINNNEIVDTNGIDDPNLLKIINAYNDTIAFNYKDKDKDGISTPYSELLANYNKLKEVLIKLKEKNEELEQNKEILEQENNNLITENEEYNKDRETIIRILQRKPE